MAKAKATNKQQRRQARPQPAAAPAPARPAAAAAASEPDPEPEPEPAPVGLKRKPFVSDLLPVKGPPEATLLNKKQVVARVNMTFPTIWKYMMDGTFPRSRIAGGKSVWIEAEINAWIANRPIRPLKSDTTEGHVANVRAAARANAARKRAQAST